MRPAGLLVAAGLLMGACGIFGPNEERVIGRIDVEVSPSLLLPVPDSVAVGQPFTVEVITQWDGDEGCYSKGESEVTITGNIARITPYDLREIDRTCPSFHGYFVHLFTIQFDATGEAQVILTARELSSGDPVELTDTVQVY